MFGFQTARPTVWGCGGSWQDGYLISLADWTASFIHAQTGAPESERRAAGGREEGGKGVFRCVNFDPTGLVLTLLPDMQTRRRTNPVSQITNDGASWDGGAALGIRGWSALAAIIGKTRVEGIRTEQGLLGRHHYLSESELLAFNGVKADC